MVLIPPTLAPQPSNKWSCLHVRAGKLATTTDWHFIASIGCSNDFGSISKKSFGFFGRQSALQQWSSFQERQHLVRRTSGRVSTLAWPRLGPVQKGQKGTQLSPWSPIPSFILSLQKCAAVSQKNGMARSPVAQSVTTNSPSEPH